MKNTNQIQYKKKLRRKARTRVKLFGTAKRPRLAAFRSIKHISAQLIDDDLGKTLVAVNDKEIKKSKAKKVEIAFEVGKLLGEKATKAGIKEAVFDRSSNKYHGRIKALAEGARKAGLKI